MGNKNSDRIPTSLFLLIIAGFFVLTLFDVVEFVEELPYVVKFILAPIAGIALVAASIIVPFYIVERFQMLGLSESFRWGLFFVLLLILYIWVSFCE